MLMGGMIGLYTKVNRGIFGHTKDALMRLKNIPQLPIFIRGAVAPAKLQGETAGWMIILGLFVNDLFLFNNFYEKGFSVYGKKLLYLWR